MHVIYMSSLRLPLGKKRNYTFRRHNGSFLDLARGCCPKTTAQCIESHMGVTVTLLIDLIRPMDSSGGVSPNSL